jgi:hypothetical protein
MQKKTALFCFYGIFCVIGVFIAFYSLLFGGSAKIPFEFGDFRLNNYFLEHSWQWIHNPQYIGKLYSPSFFFPFKNTLAFSDNLFGSAPIYWVMRLFVSSDIAFVAWIILVSCLNFAAMTFVLRQEKVHPLLAALGGFIFAFPMMRVWQLCRAQLFPQFCTPIALWLTWHFLKAPDIRKFCGILFLVYWQILCGIYLGWFLVLALMVLALVVIMANQKKRSSLWLFLCSSWGYLSAVIILWGSAVYVFLKPYIEMKGLIGGTSYEFIAQSLLPKLSSWIFAPPTNIVWSNLLGHFLSDLPTFYEHCIFIGLVGILAIVAAITSILQKPTGIEVKTLDINQRQMVKTFLLTGLILILISLDYSKDLSFWRIIYKVIPGASAIRIVSRIALIVLPCFIIAGFIGLNNWMRRLDRQKNLQVALLILITTFGMLEQRIGASPLSILDYDRSRVQAYAAQMDLNKLIQQYCQVAYISPINSDMPRKTPLIEIPYSHLDAMWAGVAANRPVINGYSGFSPPGFFNYSGIGLSDVPSAQEEKAWMISWLKTQESPPVDRLCFIQKKGQLSGQPIASEIYGVERHQSSYYQLEVIRYRVNAHGS